MAGPESTLRTLFLCDLVDSTRLNERLGDERWAALSARHDRIARDLLGPLNGREIDRTDGFLLLFERPVEAVRFAIEYHAALGRLALETGEPLAARAGIHLGEVILRVNAPEDVARGAKPIEADGLAKPLAARVMSLAQGGQTLLTRGAFDLARRGSVGESSLPADVAWLAHGPYHLKGIEEPIDIYEAGVPGIAPLAPPPDTEKARRAVQPGEEALLGWRPAPGRGIDARPHWVLREKLGEGGFGEVWLVENPKTHDKRVLKFCFDRARLNGLKREVVLFRILKETLGERDDIARVLDWNFDAAPYFIESEYTQGGDLNAWARAQGGIAAVPLPTRLALIAQVAEALSAAHSVGVLHKDIKPANVLVAATSGEPRARLTDFGIGLVVSRDVLSGGAVTQMGITDLVASTSSASFTGSRLYMAPELVEGRPATMQSDIYSLGVMLYQSVTGDFSRMITADWREDIADELLRDDIAACVHGDPRRRLGSADRLADRLRTLDERRAALARERAEKAAAEQTLADLRAAQERRRLALVAGALAAVVMAALALLYFRADRERMRALDAEAAAHASAEDARRAGQRALVGERLARESRAQADSLVRYMIGDLARRVAAYDPMLRTLDDVVLRASDYYTTQTLAWDTLVADERESVLLGLAAVGDTARAQGNLALARRQFDAMQSLALRESARQPADPRWAGLVSAATSRVGGALVAAGDLDGALAQFRRDLETAIENAARRPDDQQALRSLAFAHGAVGDVLSDKGDLEGALTSHREMARILGELAVRNPGNAEAREDRARALGRLSDAQAARGDLEAALKEARAATAIHEDLVREFPDDADWKQGLAQSRNRLGILLNDSGDASGALAAQLAYRDIMQQLVTTDPTSLVYQKDLALANGWVGNLQFDAGDTASARKSFEALRDISARLAERDPANTSWQRDHASAFLRVGDVLAAEGDTTRALDSLRAGNRIMESLSARDPSNARWLAQLATSHNRIGLLLASVGRHEEALQEQLRYRAIMESVVATGSGGVAGQRSVAVASGAIGNALEGLGRTQEALEAFRQMQSRIAQLVASDPANAGWQTDLAVAHNRVGGLLATLGRHDEAVAEFREEQAIRGRLLALSPSSRTIRRDIARSHNRTARSLAAASGAPAARADADKALALYDALIGENADPILAAERDRLRELLPPP